MREAIAAIADVWGPDNVPENPHGFRPHVSLAYSNDTGPAEPITQRLTAEPMTSAEITIHRATLIDLNRDRRAYEWIDVATVELRARTARTDNLITRRYGPRYYRRVDSGRDQLVEASGRTLAAGVVAARSLGTSDTPLGRAVHHHRSALRSVAARHGGTNLRLFGSVARGDDGQESDIDLVVDLPESTSLLELIALRRELTELLDAPVDVIPARALRPEVAAAVEREAIPL